MPQLTREQVESRKAKASRFLRDVLQDEERADEVDDESVDDYAERKKFTLTNPRNLRRNTMARGRTNAELEDLVDELQEENALLKDRLDDVVAVASGDEEDDDDEDIDDEEDDRD